jgi:hypothetical protein
LRDVFLEDFWGDFLDDFWDDFWEDCWANLDVVGRASAAFFWA